MSSDPPTTIHEPKVCKHARRPFHRPCRTTKTESDIEDIVIDGIARQRPHTIRYLCSFRKHLEPGKIYRYCTCGKSRDVFCDDTCDDTDTAPLEFSVQTAVKWTSLCACRFSAAIPFCDGSHALDPEVGRDEYAEQHGIDLEELDRKELEEWRKKCEAECPYHHHGEEDDEDSSQDKGNPSQDQGEASVEVAKNK